MQNRSATFTDRRNEIHLTAPRTAGGVDRTALGTGRDRNATNTTDRPMHQPPRTIAAGRADVADARMASASLGRHTYGTDFHTVWGVPAAVRLPQATIKPVNARPTRRGAPPH
jgi:hypothetical protein